MNSAIFVGTDTTTQGNWVGNYGSDGYAMPMIKYSLPPYDTSFVINGAETTTTWANPTTDPRALQNGSLREAAGVQSSTYFYVRIAITDGNSHLVAMYCVDWNGTGTKQQTIQAVDATSGVSLCPIQTLSNFQNGVWLIYNVSGSVNFIITNTAGTSQLSVLSGVFFGPAGTPTPTPPPVGPVPTATLVAGQINLPIGETTTLTWNTTNATTVTLNGTTTTTSGTSNVTPVLPTTYSLVATGPGGTALATLTVNPTVWPLNTTLGIGSLYPLTPDPSDIGQAVVLREAWDFALPTDGDVDQGQIGDCYFLGVLRSLAHNAPLRLSSLVTDFGDHTYGIAFVSGSNKQIIRTTGAVAKWGDTVGISGHGGVPLLEKAYAKFRTGANTYASLSSGSPYNAMLDLGLQSGSGIFSSYTAAQFLALVSANQNAGKAFTIMTGVPRDSNWIGSHCYGLALGTTPGTFKAMNPWGTSWDIDNVDFPTLCADAAGFVMEM